jgi:hypothetical protein
MALQQSDLPPIRSAVEALQRHFTGPIPSDADGQDAAVRAIDELARQTLNLLAGKSEVHPDVNPHIEESDLPDPVQQGLHDLYGYLKSPSFNQEVLFPEKRGPYRRFLSELVALLDVPTGYVRLSQMAAIVHRSPRTLEKYKSRRRDPLPDPDVPGGGGKADEWLWSRVRPWLEQQFGRRLPEKFPAHIR